MPDDHHPFDRRRNPERIDLGAVKTDLEFLIERLSKAYPAKPDRLMALPPSSRRA
jgi:hypothetical protein